MRRKLPGITTATALALAGACICTIGLNKQTTLRPETRPVTQLISQSQTQPAEEEKAVRQLFAMDTFMTFTAYGEHGEEAVQACVDEVNRLDALLSTGIETSEVSILNKEGSAEFSEDARYILERAMDVYERTSGLFDYTIYPLMHLWGFPTQEYHVATEEEIAEILPYVNASQVTLEGNTVTLGQGQKMDLGAIAKGYTSARLVQVMSECGVKSGMVNLGGNVQTLGVKPNGKKWNIGIQDPTKQTGEVLLVIATSDEAVITSGGYERFFEQDGKTYIHIVDPKTGYPVENDLSSVTIVSGDGTLADALSTSLFLMGKEKAIEFWKANHEEFETILITSDGAIAVTEGLAPYVSYDGDYETITLE